MNHSKEIMDIINSPDTVDFVSRGTDAFFQYLGKNPDIVISQTLSGRYIVAHTHRDNYLKLIRSGGSGFISSFSTVLGTLAHTTLGLSGLREVQEHPYLALKGRGVLIGIVDTGIDYTLPCFRYEDGTSKIQYIYDQTATGTAPEGFFIGSDYTNQQINEALKSEKPLLIVPEIDENGHGTYLASIAAGRQTEEFNSAAPDSELIVVKLRTAKPLYRELLCVPPWQQAAYESSSVMIGIEYIVKKARELDRPVAICLGLGSNFGSHDGFSVFEEYLSDIADLQGVCLCAAAGNESQERHHTEGKIPATGETQNIDIKVPDNAGDFSMYIWSSISDRISVSIRSPTGELVGRVPARSGVLTSVKLVLEKSQVDVVYYFPVEGSSGQLSFIRIFDATPGIWTITLYGDIVLMGNYDAWLPITGFVAPGVEFLSSSPYQTVVVPSTSIGPICCGAYDSTNQSLYPKSSWGPSRVGAMLPDLVSPGVGMEGYFPYGLGTMSGTSVSTAITTGACALLLQWGVVNGNDITMSTYQIKAYLVRGCERNPEIQYPNERWGYGILDLLKSFQLMRDL